MAQSEMRNKFIILILALTFTAASCNQLLFGGTGNMGVYQSTDFGDSFHDINKVDKKNTLNSTSVNSLKFDPSNPSVLYLASSAGLLRADSIGNGWKLLVTNILVADFAIDPTAPGTIYAVGSSDSHAKIIKTTDTGGSWKDIYTEPTTSTTVMSIAISPANHNFLLAGLATGEIIASYDGGTTWQPETNLDDKILTIRYGQNGNPYVLSSSQGLWESKDGGKTFSLLTSVLTGAVASIDAPFSSVSQFLDLAFDLRQNGVIYLGTNEGYIRTVDDGSNWTFIRMPVRNSELRTSAVGVNPKDSNNLYAVIGNTLFKSINGGVTWQTKPLPTGQEVHMIVIDPSQPNVIYLGLGVRK